MLAVQGEGQVLGQGRRDCVKGCRFDLGASAGGADGFHEDVFLVVEHVAARTMRYEDDDDKCGFWVRVTWRLPRKGVFCLLGKRGGGKG